MAQRARILAWAPAGVMLLGALGATGPGANESVPLRAPLHATIPASILGYTAHDLEVSTAAQRVAGFTDYLLRAYVPPASEATTGEPEAAGAGAGFSVYVGYYGRQLRGQTIHSPKNCLPGGGWQVLTSSTASIRGPEGPLTVNRYLIERRGDRALVLYWYQGRGRVEADEFVVKWDLLRDAALRGRTEEALVRITVPVTAEGEEAAFRLAAEVASVVVRAADAALPG